ncbi:DNA cytosine methyltransferase [Arthrobacter sp. RCC_34]|uniref:DNA cytosine methyltransferase n=1 Tax=Arthrobacter sp. RCC_34 TaxID=3239230 RepID=UPI003525E617
MTLTYAELCAGYGGLGRAIEQFFGAELAWYSEFDPAPSKIMAAHWPDAPNLGDMTLIDWATVPRVDILYGGTPCQDLSHAGRRRGMTEGTRSNLWVAMREAIATIQPQHVIWENVRGAYSATADSGLEHCPGCMGSDGSGSDTVPPLRALARVLGDLSDLGYDARWEGLRASDVGAPHHRFRVFIHATRRLPAHTSST